MKREMSTITNYWKYFVVFILALGVASCDNDDDVDDIIPDPDPTGSITAVDQTVSNDTIEVQSVTVGQDSWLVAVHSEDEDTENFIAGPMWVEEGTETNIQLALDEDAEWEMDEDGDEISLQLYADYGTSNIWDEEDSPFATETITIYFEDTMGSFADYDTNADGFLDEDEFMNTYDNDFTTWDADEDGSLSSDEFAGTTFGNTDADDDDLVDEDEWNTGYASMYGTYAEDDFATYDADGDGYLDYDEWNAAFAESGWYEAYDADGDDMVTEDEWNQGLYADWDTDDDDAIDEDEYNVYSPYTYTW